MDSVADWIQELSYKIFMQTCQCRLEQIAQEKHLFIEGGFDAWK